MKMHKRIYVFSKFMITSSHTTITVLTECMYSHTECVCICIRICKRYVLFCLLLFIYTHVFFIPRWQLQAVTLSGIFVQGYACCFVPLCVYEKNVLRSHIKIKIFQHSNSRWVYVATYI